MKLHWLLTLGCSLAACGRTPLDLGDSRPTGGSPGLGDGTLGNPEPTGGSPGVSDANGGTCYATCSTPPGPIQANATSAEIAAALIGVWHICTGGHALFTGAPSDTIGVEFAPPITGGPSDISSIMYFLRKGPAGVVRGEGSDYQQSYTVGERQVSCHSIPERIACNFDLKYSSCPREWWFYNFEHGQKGTLASF